MARPSLTVTGAVEIERKLLQRFYEPLLLLSLLDPVRSAHVDLPSNPEHGALSLMELRRSFTDQLAYLCDFKKGGDSVTAIALQSTPHGVVVRCASNDHMSSRVKAFIHETLGLLFAVHSGNHLEVEAEIFRYAVELGLDRLREDWKLANWMIVKCLKYLRINYVLCPSTF